MKTLPCLLLLLVQTTLIAGEIPGVVKPGDFPATDYPVGILDPNGDKFSKVFAMAKGQNLKAQENSRDLHRVKILQHIGDCTPSYPGRCAVTGRWG